MHELEFFLMAEIQKMELLWQLQEEKRAECVAVVIVFWLENQN